jgi:hypothetical protein
MPPEMSMSHDRFRARYGPWAFIAGASQGIGAAFAERLAARGLSLFLVARHADALERTALRLRAQHDVEVRWRAIDLASPSLIDDLRPELDGLDLGLLVCNAAYGAIRPFLHNSLEDLNAHLDLNCRAPLLLARTFAERLRPRGRGGMIIMSSLVGFHGTAMLGTYAATKAFDTVLGESLHHELREHGIDVLVCVAGATRTPNYLGTEPRYGWLRPSEHDAGRVADEALRWLGRKQVHTVGARNLATLRLFDVLGRHLASRLMSCSLSRIYRHRA